jgi:hypothetical protein
MNSISSLDKPNYNSIKIAIWLYFLFWIFEGALRKWILPSLATPLLVVRDPIAIYIIIRAFALNIKFMNPYVVFAFIFTVVSLAITLTYGHQNLFVGIYGARIMLLHFPLLFIIGSVFTRADVLKIGQVLLVLNVLMTIIVYFQFTSPQTAFINVGIGGEGSAGFSGAMGYSRPPGTFSFTTGLTIFYTGVSVFIFYYWLSKAACSRFLLITSTIALIIALPLTISRGAVVGVVIVGLFAILSSVTSIKMVFKVIFSLFAFYFLFLILQNFIPIFNIGTEAFMDRVDAANESTGKGGGLKDSILLRIWNDFIGPFVELTKYPMFSGNLGMGTNAGAQMLTGKTTFLISETEVGRLVGEQGLILGLGTVIIRILVTISMAIRSWKMGQEDKLLPFTLCGAACVALFQGQWAQPAVLGYAIIMAGLVFASIKAEEIVLIEESNE